MVVGGIGQEFGLIASCPVKADAEVIARLRERCDAYKGQVEAGAAEIERLKRCGVLTSYDALLMMQARYVLHNLNAERPGCGYDKLAEACGQVASVVSSAMRASPTIQTMQRLPDGVICKCPKMQTGPDGSHWCCLVSSTPHRSDDGATVVTSQDQS